MRAEREMSARVFVKGAFGRERGWNGQDGADRCGGQHDGDVERRNVAAAGINNNDDGDANNENEEPLNAAEVAADMPYDSLPFTKVFPVTLIDSAAQRWNVKYVTTRRDNLHSGRLADGWEKFYRANGLSVGDSVEFTRLRARELSFNGLRHGKEAVAREVVCKKI